MIMHGVEVVKPNYYQDVLKKLYLLQHDTKKIEEYHWKLEDENQDEEHLSYTVIRLVANLTHEISNTIGAWKKLLMMLLRLMKSWKQREIITQARLDYKAK